MICVVLGILENKQSSETHLYKIERDSKQYITQVPVGEVSFCI